MAEPAGMKKGEWTFGLLAGLTALCLLGIAGILVFPPGKAKPLPDLGPAPAFSFRDSLGKEFGSKDLKGRVWLADFIFVRCSGQCPLLTGAMERLQDKWKARGLELVSFTMDPNNTPAELEAYAQNTHADPACWFFLSGDSRKVTGLAKEGFHLADQNDPNSNFIHSTRFTLVDGEGRVRGTYDGMSGRALEDLDRDLGTLLPGKT
jgi:cytochrome oxidase Cu insertion factor (SCO1/SenC/PrrC family)